MSWTPAWLAEWCLWPAGWPFLLFVPLLHLALRRAERQREAALLACAGAQAPHVAIAATPRARRAQRWLYTLACAAAGLALLQPRFGEGADRARPRGADIVVVLDVSRSMLARDLEPDRLEYARRELRALSERALGDRLALVVFRGAGRLLVPLTADLAAFRTMLEFAEPLSVARGGTDLPAALREAAHAVDAARGDHTAILLLTDGDDPDGAAASAAAGLRERGIAVHCVGLGSAEGSKITIEVDGAQTFLRDANGQDVVVRMDEPSLRRLAEAGGGAFVATDGRPRPVLGIYERYIEPAAQRVRAVAERQARPNRFQWPLGLAIALFAVALVVGRRARAESGDQ